MFRSSFRSLSQHTRFPYSRLPRQQRQYAQNAADSSNFSSVVDNPARLVRTGKRHGYGIIILALIPITAFALGTWQVQRLGWKTTLIARFEDRLVRDPLPLPPRIDPAAIPAFDYRRVVARGRFRHDQEMLVGPRIHDGHDGFLVVTPLERRAEGEDAVGLRGAGEAGGREGREGKGGKGGEGRGKGGKGGEGRGRGGEGEERQKEEAETILVNRGWISREKKEQRVRKGEDALPQGEVVVQGLLREPWQRNVFTPTNRPEKGEFYFPDVEEMAGVTGARPVWVEETMQPDLLRAMDREERGVPIGRVPEVNLRNNHLQYIFTW
ncbi:MAG: hypothetical protein Q9165_001811 [Trypethelium subeluteriae]